jgi:hypothetical protein
MTIPRRALHGGIIKMLNHGGQTLSLLSGGHCPCCGTLIGFSHWIEYIFLNVICVFQIKTQQRYIRINRHFHTKMYNSKVQSPLVSAMSTAINKTQLYFS